MKSVSIQDLKKHLSALIADAEAGESIVITRHRRPVARLVAADTRNLHVGARFGKAQISSAVLAPPSARYLEILEEDRRESRVADGSGRE